MAERHGEARRFGALSVDANSRSVRVFDHEVSATAVEFALLEALSEHPGWLYSYSQLGSRLRHDNSGDPHTIAVHISNLRRKLRAAGLAGNPIETVRGLGYRLVSRDSSEHAGATPIPTGPAESLGDALAACGRCAEAAEAYAEALASVQTADRAASARLHIKLAQTAIDRRLIAEADLHNAAAVRDIEALPTNPGRDSGLIDARLQSAALMYYSGAFGDAYSACEQLADGDGTRLSPRQSVQRHAFSYLSLANAARFSISAEALAHARACYEAWRDTGLSDGAPFAEGLLGSALLWSGDLSGAEHCLSDALRHGEVRGDASQRPPLLGNLGLVARARGDATAARYFAEVLLAEIDEKESPDHSGGAHGLLSWAAWREGSPEEAREEGVRGTTAMRAIPRFPFRWIALAPLMAIEARNGDVATAVPHARAMLDPSQQRLPEAFLGPLEHAVTAWDDDRPADAADALRRAAAAGRASGHT
jgi:DNA-binding winged helix-turn-helix (wHTH) protein